MPQTTPRSITSLIVLPALITLGITILRLAGELEHWPSPWFSAAAGGGAAIVGISWLALIFGPYFAVKLAGANAGPASAGKAMGFAFLGLVALFVGGVVAQASFAHHPTVALLGLLLMLVSAFVPGIGWRALGNTLLAYAFAARIPVLIVMLVAMLANAGQGWGTHYDVAPAGFPAQSLGAKFLHLAVYPQMTLWIGWTVVLGSIVGSIAAAIGQRGRQAAPAPI